jgi:hypothetical protein
MKSGVTRKMKTGASIVTALTMGALSVVSSNVPTQAAKLQMQGSGCDADVTKSSTYVFADAVTCNEVQVAAKCYYSGVYAWAYGPKGASSRVACPYVKDAAVRARKYSTSSWGPWNPF